MIHLPDELWSQIFYLAINDDAFLSPALNNFMAESEWFKAIIGNWWLRSPSEALNTQLRRSYSMKKAIVHTCRSFYAIGMELLLRCTVISTPSHLNGLLASLSRNPSLGRYIQRIHLYRDCRGARSRVSMMDLSEKAMELLQLTPNLRIFLCDFRMGTSFGSIAHSLCSRSATRLALWSLKCEIVWGSQTRVIAALDSLPSLRTLHLTISPPFSAQDQTESQTLAGSRSFIQLHLPHLHEVILSGSIQEFVEMMFCWETPSLRCLTLDFGSCKHDFPDIPDLLLNTPVGPQLEMLDLVSIPSLDVASILAACPNLLSFGFKLDWPLGGVLTHSPHPRIEQIGLHGLRHAFGVGPLASTLTHTQTFEFESALIRRCNDANFYALNKRNFPRLKTVRVVEREVLRNLNENNGPRCGSCFERWERWWEQCAMQRIRLEDCTGGLLGTLPQDEEDYGEDEEEDEDDEETVVEEEEEEESVWEASPGEVEAQARLLSVIAVQ